MKSAKLPARITLLGTGFGALSTLRELRRRDRAARITRVAPRAELHHLPGIVWIPSGLRTRADLVVPLDNFLRRMDVHFHAAEVTGLADGRRTLHTTQGDVADLQGRAANATFKVDLICIVDAIAHGTLNWRTPERNGLLPSTRLFHRAKRGFEWNCLRQYR